MWFSFYINGADSSVLLYHHHAFSIKLRESSFNQWGSCSDLELIIVGHVCGQPRQRLTAWSTNSYQKRVTSRMFDNPSDSRYMFNCKSGKSKQITYPSIIRYSSSHQNINLFINQSINQSTVPSIYFFETSSRNIYYHLEISITTIIPVSFMEKQNLKLRLVHVLTFSIFNITLQLLMAHDI